MNFILSLLVILPLVWANQTNASLSSQEKRVCTDTHIFLARGWNEPYPGRQEVFIGAILTALYHSPTSTDYEDILYHSAFDAIYCDSIFEGVANGTSQLIAYNKRCPNSNLAVSGYSQGTYIVSDMFGGGEGTFGDCMKGSNERLDVTSDVGKKCTAVMMWGSKRHTASQPYNTFSGAEKHGTYPRPAAELDTLQKWTSVLRNYCVIANPNCARGSANEDYWDYFDLYSDQAAEWVRNQVENNITPASQVAQSNSTATSSTASSNPSQISVSSPATPAKTQASNLPSTASTTASSAISTSSWGVGGCGINILPSQTERTCSGRIFSCQHLERALLALSLLIETVLLFGNNV